MIKLKNHFVGKRRCSSGNCLGQYIIKIWEGVEYNCGCSDFGHCFKWPCCFHVDCDRNHVVMSSKVLTACYCGDVVLIAATNDKSKSGSYSRDSSIDGQEFEEECKLVQELLSKMSPPEVSSCLTYSHWDIAIHSCHLLPSATIGRRILSLPNAVVVDWKLHWLNGLCDYVALLLIRSF